MTNKHLPLRVSSAEVESLAREIGQRSAARYDCARLAGKKV